MREMVCEKIWKKYAHLKILSIIILAFLMLICIVDAEPFAYITNYNNNSLSVIDIENNTIITTVSVGAGPYGAAVSPDGTKVYVTNFDDNTTSIIDIATNTVTATLNVGEYPNAVAVTPDGTRAYITDDNVSVIDTTINAVITTVPVGASPAGVAVNSEGTEIYVTNYGSDTVSVIDNGTNTVTATISVGNGPWGVAVTPNGRKVYVANNDSNSVSVIDTTTNNVTATIPVGVGPWEVGISPTGTDVYVTNKFDNTVSVINTDTNTVTAIVPVGDTPRGVVVSAGGTEVYVTNSGSDNLSVINTSTKQVTESIFVGQSPYDIAIQPLSVPTSTPELFTTYSTNVISSIYHLYSTFGIPLVSYNITNTGVNAFEVTVSSEITGYTNEAINKRQIQPGEFVQISQTPLFKPGVLSTLNEKKGANLHFKVIRSENGVEQIWDEQTIPIELYAKDTMVLGYIDSSGVIYSLHRFLVAWVTPHAREIDELLRKAAEYVPGRAMGDAKTQEERLAQVKAIYYALKNYYDITYIDSPISYSNNNNESTQRIKLPKDAINLKSANCIEGTIIFASALESIGMDPYIILIPGHAFLVWGDGQGNFEGALETTMIGSSNFEDAYNEGIKEYNQEVNNGNFSNNVSRIISVKKYRASGITPIE